MPVWIPLYEERIDDIRFPDYHDEEHSGLEIDSSRHLIGPCCLDGTVCLGRIDPPEGLMCAARSGNAKAQRELQTGDWKELRRLPDGRFVLIGRRWEELSEMQYEGGDIVSQEKATRWLVENGQQAPQPLLEAAGLISVGNHAGRPATSDEARASSKSLTGIQEREERTGEADAGERQVPQAPKEEAEAAATTPARPESLAKKAPRRKQPPDYYFAAYRFFYLLNFSGTQTEAAAELSRLLGRHISQPRLSLILKRVEQWLGAGNALPAPSPGRPKPACVDPRRLELGPREDGRRPGPRRPED